MNGQQRRVGITTLCAVMLGASACSSGPGVLDTAPVAELVDDVLDEFSDGDDFQILDDCLIDDADDLLEDIFDDSDDDNVDVTLRGDFEAAANDFGDEYLDCSFFDDDFNNSLGFYFLEAPRDFEDFAFDFAVGDGDDDGVDVDVDEGEEFRGGQFFQVCVEYDREVAYCEVDWVDENLLIGVYVANEEADRVDLDDIEVKFREILPDIIDDLADDEEDDVDIADEARS